jgi:hypothetical protein
VQALAAPLVHTLEADRPLLPLLLQLVEGAAFERVREIARDLPGSAAERSATKADSARDEPFLSLVDSACGVVLALIVSGLAAPLPFAPAPGTQDSHAPALAGAVEVLSLVPEKGAAVLQAANEAAAEVLARSRSGTLSSGAAAACIAALGDVVKGGLVGRVLPVVLP